MVELPECFVAVDWQDSLEVPEETHDKTEFSDVFAEEFRWSFPDLLGRKLYNFFDHLTHSYRRCFDSPAKSPRNEEIESAIKNKGQTGSCTFFRDGNKFIVRPLTEWMFSGLRLHRKHYYTSDRRVALLYFDIDCHMAYQTEAEVAAARTVIEQEFLNRLGVAPLFVESNRGENGYLQVNLAGVEPEKANAVFDELQEAIRLLFAKFNLLADFEIKGTITWLDRHGKLHAGRYGKLPMCAEDWTYNWHRKLVQAKQVSIKELEKFIADVKSLVTPEDISKHAASKRRALLAHYVPVANDKRWMLRKQFHWSVIDDHLVSFESQKWIARCEIDEELIRKICPNYQPDLGLESVSAVSRPIEVPHQDETASDSRSSFSSKKMVEFCEVHDEPDAFVRQRTTLLRYARLIKRVPTLKQALEFIKDNGLYSGEWKNSARASRVRGILKFIAQTFDPRKCLKSGSSMGTVNLGKFDAWAKKKFPNGLVGGKRRKTVTEDFQIVDSAERVSVSWEFISVFVSICEYCLLLDKNDDDSLPHQRAKDLWNWLHENQLVSVAFDDRKWAVCRDGLEKLGIIKITDRNYATNKAMRWAVAPFFPLLGLWKSSRQRRRNGEARCWADLGDNSRKEREEEHNSLLSQVFIFEDDFCFIPPAQPPPVVNSS